MKINLSNNFINQYKAKRYQIMLSIQSPARLRLINLLIPPSHDPLLTPYRKQINPKVMPLKRSLSILSNTKARQTVKQQILQLSKKDYQKINRSYQSLRKFKKKYDSFSENDEERFADPQYINLIELRKSILTKKRRNQRAKSSNNHITSSYVDQKQSQLLELIPAFPKQQSKQHQQRSYPNKQNPRYYRQNTQQPSMSISSSSPLYGKPLSIQHRYFYKG